MNVYDRFQLQKIETDLQMILTGIPVKMKTYPNHPERNPQPILYTYSGQDSIIIDGVVGLSSEVLRDLAHFKLFDGPGRSQKADLPILSMEGKN